VPGANVCGFDRSPQESRSHEGIEKGTARRGANPLQPIRRDVGACHLLNAIFFVTNVSHESIFECRYDKRVNIIQMSSGPTGHELNSSLLTTIDIDATDRTISMQPIEADILRIRDEFLGGSGHSGVRRHGGPPRRHIA